MIQARLTIVAIYRTRKENMRKLQNVFYQSNLLTDNRNVVKYIYEEITERVLPIELIN